MKNEDQKKYLFALLFVAIFALVAFSPGFLGTSYSQSNDLIGFAKGGKPGGGGKPSGNKQSCIDYDGGRNYYVASNATGTLKGRLVTYYDKCSTSNENAIEEAICVKGKPQMTTWAGCEYGCYAGKCNPAAYCPDGKVNQVTEQCDGSDLGGKTCSSFGYNSGYLKCNSNCQIVISECSNTPMCGDGIVNTPYEVCDGPSLMGTTCISFGYTGGTLGCNSNCQFDVSDCYGAQYPLCGDGVVNQPNEDCDTTDMNGRTCQHFGYIGGILQCGNNCRYSFVECIMNRNETFQ